MIPYTKKDIVVFVSYSEVEWLNLSEKRVYFFLKDKNGELHDLYYYFNEGASNEGDESDFDDWYEWMHEEIIPSRFSGATEVEYQYKGFFEDVPDYLWDCGFRDIQLFGFKFRAS